MVSQENGLSGSYGPGRGLLPVAAADLACVLLFAIVGRSSHAEANDVAGVLHTAWPFLVGCLAGLLVSRSWRSPMGIATGTVVWACTVLGGLGLRLASGDTAQPSFVVVTTVVLGVLLVGWRVVLRLVRRARNRQQLQRVVPGPIKDH